MKRNPFALRLAAGALCALLASGCSILPYESPEEQRAAQEAAEVSRVQAETVVDPAALLTAPLRLSRAMVTESGLTLASYQVTFPQFAENEAKGQSFARINRYFQNEFTGLEEDCDSLFSRARKHYGDNWPAVTAANADYVQTVDYTLLDAPEGYLCIRLDRTTALNSQRETESQAVAFLLDNGWELSLETLLGSDYAQAAPMLLEDILAWCDKQGIEITGRDALTLEDFSQGFALTGEGFIFYTQPFLLNSRDGTRYAIPVSLEKYQEFLDPEGSQ